MTKQVEPHEARTQGEEDEYEESAVEKARNIEHALPSLSELRAAIPSQCFRPSALRSLFYLVRDLAISIALYFIASHLYELCSSALVESFILRLLALSVLFLVYWYAQGTMMWALFVVGHDAGHGSFSSSPLLNEICGHVAHTPLLVPYHCWRISHRHHHKHTGHLDRDEIFYPIRWRRVHSRTARERYWSHWRLSGHLYGLFYVGLAWPLYLFASYEGDVSMANSHLVWWSKRFRTPKERSQARRSLLLLYAQVALLLLWTYTHGVAHVFLFYTVPYLVFASWLVIVTFLHHNMDPRLEWTDDRGGWTWVRGQLVTIDRDYGVGLQSITHHIGLHAAHHLFMGIPHYCLPEATVALRRALGSRYVFSEERILSAFWHNWITYREHMTCPDDAVSFRYPPRKTSSQETTKVN